MAAERPRYAMPNYVRMPRQWAGYAMTYQVDLGTLMLRQIPGQLVVRPIHSTPRREVARYDRIRLGHCWMSLLETSRKYRVETIGAEIGYSPLTWPAADFSAREKGLRQVVDFAPTERGLTA